MTDAEELEIARDNPCPTCGGSGGGYGPNRCESCKGTGENKHPRSPKMNDEKPMVNLGYCNGWTETPEIVKKCNEAQDRGEKHEFDGGNEGRCLNRTTCLTCGYTYLTDSSD